MIKLLIGGSPCTYWSIAQSPQNREKTPSGLGWELFKNYLIAKEKFKPDFFLYENNKSAATAIKEQIKSELQVYDGTLLMADSGVRYIEINSALVSAQNRARFYVHNCGEVQQPADRHIYLKDIIEHGESFLQKAYALTTRCNGAIPSDTLTATMRQNALAVPVENVGDAETIQKALPKLAEKYGYIPEMFNAYNVAEVNEKSPTLSTGSMVTSSCATTIFTPTDEPVYEVKDGFITIKDKSYPIKLADGFYIIRKLTVAECARLQTMPEDYCRAVSPTQAYKGLGNGWTAEVIIHILSNALRDVPRSEKLVVLSMYDGIATGRYCLDKMGFSNVDYYAYEIDKHAIKVALSNYPDIMQLGDAFALRQDGWSLPIGGGGQ